MTFPQVTAQLGRGAPAGPLRRFRFWLAMRYKRPGSELTTARMQQQPAFLYCAVGKKFSDLAAISAVSLREVQADAFIEIHTDQSVEAGLFDRVVQIAVNSADPVQVKLQKILAIKNTALEQFLYLDCDTYILQSLAPMFGILDGYDLAACYDWWRNASPSWMGTSLNAGVMLFPRRAKAMELASAWEMEFLHDPYLPIHSNPVRDQPALERAIASAKTRVFVLPLEFNFRFNEPGQIAGAVKILHGHWKTADELRRLGEFLNQDLGGRTFDPETGLMIAPSPETRKYYVFKPGSSADATECDVSATLNRLQAQVDDLRADQQAKEELIYRLSRNLEEIEADRRAKDEVIVRIGRELQEIEGDRRAKDELIRRVQDEHREIDADRRAKDEVIGRLTRDLQEIEADRRAKDEVINRVVAELESVRADQRAKEELITRLGRELEEIEVDRRAKDELIHRISRDIERAEADRRTSDGAVERRPTSRGGKMRLAVPSST